MGSASAQIQSLPGRHDQGTWSNPEGRSELMPAKYDRLQRYLED